MNSEKIFVVKFRLEPNNLVCNFLGVSYFNLAHKVDDLDGDGNVNAVESSYGIMNKKGFIWKIKHLQAVIEPSITWNGEFYKFLVGDGDVWVLKVTKRPLDNESGTLELVHRTQGLNIRAAVAMGQDWIYMISDGFARQK